MVWSGAMGTERVILELVRDTEISVRERPQKKNGVGLKRGWEDLLKINR